MKQTCPIHHFTYSGTLCPFCEEERIQRLAHRYEISAESNVVGNFKKSEHFEKEISDDDLSKLALKFNVRRK